MRRILLILLTLLGGLEGLEGLQGFEGLGGLGGSGGLGGQGGGTDFKSLFGNTYNPLGGPKDIFSSTGKDYGNFNNFADAYNLVQDLFD